ncbi:hypothetical protein CYMTET_50944 [Cymbomonas tetramitiformis]|uniref:Uncharacterized protein n=1 Tax=Cymbomonas tetramitiformis TaxID=36881 RepID=A0AAE0ET71_9CHLO|nr:hypothetical protein CYMTET_50944 [Cymbomonas tetramitiformis]
MASALGPGAGAALPLSSSASQCVRPELAQRAERLAERRRTGRQTHNNELLLLAPDTEPRAQLLVQAQQKYGAEPQRNSQPMAVQWGTQLEAFAEELAAVQRN